MYCYGIPGEHSLTDNNGKRLAHTGPIGLPEALGWQGQSLFTTQNKPASRISRWRRPAPLSQPTVKCGGML